MPTKARFDLSTEIWTQMGDLNAARGGHGVFYDGRVFLIIGGRSDRMTESCTLSEFSMSCTYLDTQFPDYAYYPGLFAVTEDFCTNLSVYT